MSIILGPNEMLRYDQRYCILICRECKYAIQKSAVNSHLLRHHIYRGDRQSLRSSIDRLRLLEPEDVPLPPARSPPVDELPVISGYRCTVGGCLNLCASEKRMKRHLSDAHSSDGTLESASRPAALQTFFRGTKLRYFEVLPADATTEVFRVASNESDEQDVSDQLPPFPAAPRLDIELETLKYFHNFLYVTSAQLPNGNGGSNSYWSEAAVLKALDLTWLMSGLLAISAMHMAVNLQDKREAQRHQAQSKQLFQTFNIGFESCRCDLSSFDDLSSADMEEVRLGAQIACIQKLCSWLPITEISDQEPFWLHDVMMAIQGCHDPEVTFRMAYLGDRGLDATDVQSTLQIGRLRMRPRLPDTFVILQSFATLPDRMTEALGRPESTLDVFAPLSAIDTLIECYQYAHAEEDTLKELVPWLSGLSGHFREMVRRHNPAALIVLAHLVPLVESAGMKFWFMEGLARRILIEILRLFPEGSVAKTLVMERLAIMLPRTAREQHIAWGLDGFI